MGEEWVERGGRKECARAGRSVRVGEWQAGNIVRCMEHTHTQLLCTRNPLSKTLITFIACTVQLVNNTQPISNLYDITGQHRSHVYRTKRESN